MAKYENNIGVLVPEILFPNQGVDLSKWAVVACDQYTSEPEYWQETEKIVGDAPSTLRLMLPEMYLDKPGEAERIEDINSAMQEYMGKGILQNIGEGFVLVRRTAEGKTRNGLVVALDLENYSYEKGAQTLIRATEGTIVERIPPRLRIRKDATLEMPHILVLIDDPERTVIEPLLECADGIKKLYDFDLMQGGGHIEGYFVDDDALISKALSALKALADPKRFAKSYGPDKAPMLFAMGDGNHSFATAKANWERCKAQLSAEEAQNHRSRYCLVELENVHDQGIVFEPIHRVVFGLDTQRAVQYIKEKMASQACEVFEFTCEAEYERALSGEERDGRHILPFVTERGRGYFRVTRPSAQLEVGTLQNALDVMLNEIPGCSIDYIHGEDVVTRLGSKPGNMGFTLPPMHKSALFRTVVFDGALPRKTFSMGEANEKRYYLECRRIK